MKTPEMLKEEKEESFLPEIRKVLSFRRRLRQDSPRKTQSPNPPWSTKSGGDVEVTHQRPKDQVFGGGEFGVLRDLKRGEWKILG